MPKFVIVMCICGIFATVTVLRGTRLMHLKTKTFNSFIISVVFLSYFKKFKCQGNVLDSVSLRQFATLR